MPHVVLFGAVEGENRGANPMDPPLERVDDLFWLRDDRRSDPAVLAHLRAENAHTDAHLAHVRPLADAVYDEIIATIQETDDDVAFPWGPDFEYFVRTTEGKAYPEIRRRRRLLHASADAADSSECVLDVDALAKSLPHCTLGSFRVSPDHKTLAYAIDATGYETYEIRFKNLETGERLPDVLENTAGAVSWGARDAASGAWNEVYYSTQDDAHRPDKVWRHTLGADPKDDALILVEEDELFCVGFGRTSDGRFMLLECESSETNEVRVVDLETDHQGAAAGFFPRLVQKRRRGHRYYAEHRGAHWFVLSNRDRKDFDLFVCPEAQPEEESWMRVPERVGGEVVQCAPDDQPAPGSFAAGRLGRTLETLSVFETFLVLEGREDGFAAAWILNLAPLAPDPNAAAVIENWRKVEFAGASGSVYTSSASSALGCVGANQRFDAAHVFLTRAGATEPKTVYRVDAKTGAKAVAKRTPAIGFDEAEYETMRMEVPSRDGRVKIPVSVAWRRDKVDFRGRDEGKGNADAADADDSSIAPLRPSPLLLTGYGSYGISDDPSFMREDVSLMNRGVVIATAHVRGGGEMGRDWYEKEGKFLTKKNTFFDFQDVAACLIRRGWTEPAKLAVTGRSAGGLLVGAVVNLDPSLFRCAVAAVPFVDVMTSMCDASIPLTTGEWEEWGNPNEREFHEYMLSYSPMENVPKPGQHAGTWPDVLVTGGLHDPRVAYWEGAKYAQRLREGAGDGGARILLKTDLDAGHFSASDRYKYYREKALEHAFVLDALGLNDDPEARPSWAAAKG